MGVVISLRALRASLAVNEKLNSKMILWIHDLHEMARKSSILRRHHCRSVHGKHTPIVLQVFQSCSFLPSFPRQSKYITPSGTSTAACGKANFNGSQGENGYKVECIMLQKAFSTPNALCIFVESHYAVQSPSRSVHSKRPIIYVSYPSPSPPLHKPHLAVQPTSPIN
jgi:hypothetical protein